jgi:F0F1-type ATP synthase alpha subunit
VVFPNGQAGIVVMHRPPLAFVYADMDEFKEMDKTVEILDTFASVTVNEEIKAVDCFGRSFGESVSVAEGVSEAEGATQRAIFSPIPKVSDIDLINSPLLTGVTMFDALAPIGKGQNMLLVGNDIDDMRGYVCDFLSTQRKKVKCIYAATEGGEHVTNMLREAGLLDDVIMVSSRSSENADKESQAAEATVVAATGCAIAESYAREKGEDTLVVIDNIDQHKKLWDATTRVLVDVFGVDAVVKADLDGGSSSEMRAFFSSLIQRSAKFDEKRGGGSVTLLLLVSIPNISGEGEDAIYQAEDFKGSPVKVLERIDLLVKRNVPLTVANLRKIQIPIPSASEGVRRLSLQHIDELISMSDGQIMLDEKVKEAGRRPAMNFQRSVTRIGIGSLTESRADAPAVRRVIEGLRLDLSQAEYMDGADVTTATVKQIQSARAWLLAMHQTPASGSRLLSESCAILLAAAEGYLGDSVDKGILAGTKEGEDLVNDLLDHVKNEAPSAMDAIDSSDDLMPAVRDDIENAIKSFFASK